MEAESTLVMDDHVSERGPSREDLVAWFGDVTEREKREVQIVAECYTKTMVNIATELGMCSSQSLEMLESEHHLVTALSVESWPALL